MNTDARSAELAPDAPAASSSQRPARRLNAFYMWRKSLSPQRQTGCGLRWTCLYLKLGAPCWCSPFRKPEPMELQHVAQPRCVLLSLKSSTTAHNRRAWAASLTWLLPASCVRRFAAERRGAPGRGWWGPGCGQGGDGPSRSAPCAPRPSECAACTCPWSAWHQPPLPRPPSRAALGRLWPRLLEGTGSVTTCALLSPRTFRIPHDWHRAISSRAPPNHPNTPPHRHQTPMVPTTRTSLS